MYNVIDLSNYIISLFDEQNAPITNLKLQKVLYYVQGYFIKVFGREAFQNEIHCWCYGPVVQKAYFEYNLRGSERLVASYVSPLHLTNIEQELIQKIVSKCKIIPSSRLVAMTHEEFPWKNAKQGEVISKQSIKNFFMYSNPLEIRL